jgi:hypothetical protein
MVAALVGAVSSQSLDVSLFGTACCDRPTVLLTAEGGLLIASADIRLTVREHGVMVCSPPRGGPTRRRPIR